MNKIFQLNQGPDDIFQTSRANNSLKHAEVVIHVIHSLKPAPWYSSIVIRSTRTTCVLVSPRKNVGARITDDSAKVYNIHNVFRYVFFEGAFYPYTFNISQIPKDVSILHITSLALRP